MVNPLVTPSTPTGQSHRGIIGGMFHRSGTWGFAAALLWVCSATSVLPCAVGAQSSPAEVTSDTPEYCVRLLDIIARLVNGSAAPPPHEVFDLSSEGQRMCDQGQTRGGILRLRRALLIMKHLRE